MLNDNMSTVLIVEDNIKTSQEIQDLLGKNGLLTIAVENGQDAIDTVAREKVDIVLLDIMMPDMSGLTVANKIKALKKSEEFIPIIMVTALSGEEDKVAGLACGDDYITKPFSSDELIARIRSLLRIRKLHQELRQSKIRYQLLYENMPLLCISINSKWEVTDCNQPFCQMLAMSKIDIVNKSIFSFFPDYEHEILKDFFSILVVNGTAPKQVFQLRIRENTMIPVEANAVYLKEKEMDLSIIISMEDISMRVRLEEEQKLARKQLYRSARLASIGTLASGVAHEINNPLTAILGFSSALIDRIKENSAMRIDEFEQYLTIINKEAIRCRDIVENLSKFSRDGETIITKLTLAECVRDAVKLIHAKINKVHADIKINVSQEYFVHADPNKLKQVIVNILANCLDFASEKPSIKIEASLRQQNPKKISLEISDNGPGIDSQILPKVFDPFFTTKEVGKGIGMGLALCHRIMEECDGSIDIKSELGFGTTVILQIPNAQI